MICRVDDLVDQTSPVALPRLERAAERAVELMVPVIDQLDRDIETAEALVLECTTTLVAAKLALLGPDDAVPVSQNRRRATRGERQNYAAMAGVGVRGETPVDTVALANAYAEASMKTTLATRKLDDAKKKKAAMLSRVPVTKAGFEALGRACIQPGFTYYQDHFNEEGGRLYRLKLGFRAAEVFDPIKLPEMTVSCANLLIDDLVYFDFPEFTTDFLDGMKKEFLQIRGEALKPFNWDDVPGAKEYEASMKRKRDSLTRTATRYSREVAFRDWKSDPMETARRIWEWWRMRLVGSTKFVFWRTAVRLVVLVQPSSAAAERVFSQLKLIVDAIGHSELEETLVLRLLRVCNGGK